MHLRPYMLALLVVAAAAGCAVPEGAGPPERLIATGNQEALFVVLGATVDGMEGFRFWQRDAAGAWRFDGEGVGEPVTAAACGARLMVFLPTGRYGLFSSETPEIFPAPMPSFFPMAVSGDGQAVDAFGWDADSNPMYARLQEGTWRHDRIGAAIERDKVLDPTAARFKGRAYLIWREKALPVFVGPPSYRIRFVYLEKSVWSVSPLSRIYLDSPPRIAASADRMVCLYRKPGAAGSPGPWAVATYETADEDFHEVGLLQTKDPLPPGPIAVGRLGDRFFAVASPGQSPSVADLDVETARAEAFLPLQAAGEVAATEPQAPGFYNLALLVIAFVMFLLLLGWRDRQARQRGGAVPAAQPVGLATAPLGRRAGAVVLDSFLVSAVVLSVVIGFYPEFPRQVWQREVLPWQEVLVVSAVHDICTILYFSIAEAVTGRTVGKAVFGLEVRTESDEPITWRHAVLRNVLRLVDELPMLYLAGLVSVLMGPKPQRLGDRVAHTLVVLRRTGQGTM